MYHLKCVCCVYGKYLGEKPCQYDPKQFNISHGLCSDCELKQNKIIDEMIKRNGKITNKENL